MFLRILAILAVVGQLSLGNYFFNFVFTICASDLFVAIYYYNVKTSTLSISI